ncbi:AMP-binding protein [Pseudonocardia pini]|uniref:AMP-binding protein n=1 Tax=Pseudonocardia pini TaxID=2758030 RepID=UPI0015F0E7F1|nr:AMP-binding protein [Pseudonocardia pini]
MSGDGASPRTLRELLSAQQERHGDRTFLVFESAQGTTSTFTYDEFVDLVRRTAQGFSGLGIGPGDAVVLHLPNCPDFLVSWFSLAWIGAVAVPSNTANTERELRHLVQHSEAVAYVTTAAYERLFDQVVRADSGEVLGILADGPRGRAAERTVEGLGLAGGEAPDVPLDGDAVCELLFTSGTTSAPKAVMVTHANLIRAGVRKVFSYEFGPEDRLITALPLFHANAQTTTVMAALVAGATCIVLESFSARRYWRQVREHRATSTNLVAMQVRTLLAQPPDEEDRAHSLRVNFYAINVLDEEKEAFERRFGLRLMNGWGLSEAMCVVTRAPLRGEDRWPSVGLPLYDRAVRIVDDEGADAPTGTIGEIVVAGTPGVTLMKGYFKDPQATAEALRDGWLHTGDNGYLDRDGYLYFCGRRKDMIKRAGENIAAVEVEQVLLTHPAVAEAAVIGVPDPVRDEAVMAFVMVDDGHTLSTDDLTEHCRGRLADFKIPTAIQIVHELPRTAIGKIEKKALRRMVGESS